MVLPANIVGAYNVYEAARQRGVKRIVFASSNHVIGFYSQGETITPQALPRPDSYYGLSKAFGENLAQFYFDRYGLETVSLRIDRDVRIPVEPGVTLDSDIFRPEGPGKFPAILCAHAYSKAEQTMALVALMRPCSARAKMPLDTPGFRA